MDVVRVLIAAGADITAPHHGSPHHGVRPLDLADDPRIARLLIEAGAPPSTGRPSTPLHVACLRAADRADDRAADWAEVAELLLDHGADPGLRDEFGALPSDLVGEGRRDLRDRLTSVVDGSVDLTLEDAAARPQEYVAVHPDRPEALTATFSGTVLVRWRLTPSITPVELIRVGGRSPIRGPYGTGGGRLLAFVDDDIAGTPGDATSASLCFTPDGSLLAVGLDDCVLWLDAGTGEPVGREETGAVAALAAHDTVGVIAATRHGLRRLDPTAATPVERGTAGKVAGRLERWISASDRLPRSS